MDDLITWLRAQLDDDGRVALGAACGAAGWRHDLRYNVVWDGTGGAAASHMSPNGTTGAHIARWDPARVLAEIDAKRRILDLHHPVPADDVPGLVQCAFDSEVMPCTHVRLLALPCADRPGYLEVWRP